MGSVIGEKGLIQKLTARHVGFGIAVIAVYFFAYIKWQNQYYHFDLPPALCIKTKAI